jgi:hypothetical protein
MLGDPKAGTEADHLDEYTVGRGLHLCAAVSGWPLFPPRQGLNDLSGYGYKEAVPTQLRF